MKTPLFVSVLVVSGAALTAQTLYVPGGTSTGIGNNIANGNVGIGTAAPTGKFHVSTSASGLAPMFYSGNTLPQFPAVLENISGSNQGNSAGTIVGLNLENASTTSGTYSPFITFSRKSDSNSFNPMIGAIGALYTGQGPDSNWGAGALTFWTAGTAVHGPVERMRIDQSGNIGIGTTTPSAKLEIAVPTNGADGIQITRPSSPTWQLMNYGPFYIQEAGVGPRLVVAQGGNVGIGTATPSAKLDVRGDIRAYRDGADTISSQIYFANSANNRAWNWQLTANGESAFWGYDGASWIEAIRVKSNGNVGIGTTNPTQKLSVNGTIRAKEVIVDTGWSDYVFADNYRLAPLSEVESHIKAERHLPGIPSAAEVAEHGVSMGEMQSKLLAKIEELTLHQIAQEKELRRLREQNEKVLSLLKQ